MADENVQRTDDQEQGQGEAPTPPQGPEGQEGAPQGAPDDADGARLTDSHGQPGISRAKYEREMAAKDRTIAELRSQVEEMSRTEEGRKELLERIDKLEHEGAESEIRHKLELRGCVDVKAARARLDDFDDDVDRLADACPYLFGQEKRRAGSTGLPPAGATDEAAERRARARRAAGLPEEG